ncbi:MAG: glycosyltransferase [Phycisphaerales bacterium]|nr:glycosyltransferase [Phycisphaerales bacterium]
MGDGTREMVVLTSVWLWLLLIGLAGALVTLVMTWVNLGVYRRSRADAPPAPEGGPPGPKVSVCIPARNEEANVEAAIRSVLAQDWARVEAVVYDDHSTDATPRILARLAAEDPRVVRAETRALEPGWIGKQWACQQAARAATGDWLLFTDADVRFAPDCVRRTLDEARRLDADLVSTFPRQITGSLSERLIIPMIFFILFSYLPMPRMRRTRLPAASAGCGQFLFISRSAYEAIGGHAAWKESMHDGIRMPRAVRAAGRKSDLFDGTDLCECRMYRGLVQTWRGFAKNAYEGLGSVGLLVFLTVAHAAGHVLPWVYLPLAWAGLADADGVGPAACAVAANLVQRLMLSRRFGHPAWLALLHPLAVLMMTAIQWHSYILYKTGRRTWRQRTFDALGRASA